MHDPAPFGWRPEVALDVHPRGLDTQGAPLLEPDGLPSGPVSVLARGAGGEECVASGGVCRVFHPDRIGVELVYVDQEELRESLPFLLVLERGPQGSWTIAKGEPTFQHTANDPELEALRLDVQRERLSGLLERRARLDGARGPFVQMLEREYADEILGSLKSVEAWHRDRGLEEVAVSAAGDEPPKA